MVLMSFNSSLFHKKPSLHNRHTLVVVKFEQISDNIPISCTDDGIKSEKLFKICFKLGFLNLVFISHKLFNKTSPFGPSFQTIFLFLMTMVLMSFNGSLFHKKASLHNRHILVVVKFEQISDNIAISCTDDGKKFEKLFQNMFETWFFKCCFYFTH